jgi:hypothetical protein
MKLPTLNVDVAVNTSTMKKDIARANKELQSIGGKGLAFAGGSFGKLGALGGLGGGLGGAAIATGGIALAVAAPFMAAGKIVDTFNQSMKAGAQTLDTFAKTGKSGEMNIAMALPLAMAQQRTPEFAQKGFLGGLGDAFSYGMTDQYGNVGGLMGLLQEAGLTLKGIFAAAGSWLGGQDKREADRKYMIASAESQGAAMTYMTDTERAQLRKAIEDQTRQKREQET